MLCLPLSLTKTATLLSPCHLFVTRLCGLQVNSTTITFPWASATLIHTYVTKATALRKQLAPPWIFRSVLTATLNSQTGTRRIRPSSMNWILMGSLRKSVNDSSPPVGLLNGRLRSPTSHRVNVLSKYGLKKRNSGIKVSQAYLRPYPNPPSLTASWRTWSPGCMKHSWMSLLPLPSSVI
ncbi:hypothetical protein L218DRAFT_1064804 [Marasmius fiardii PR-910]|nr:hypothetical protein L218DRAFT_1064804 [Marasmius fiardii PR-910]